MEVRPTQNENEDDGIMEDNMGMECKGCQLNHGKHAWAMRQIHTSVNAFQRGTFIVACTDSSQVFGPTGSEFD